MKTSKKGFALPTVIVVMFVIVAMSTIMLTLVVGANMTNQYNKVLFDRQNQISKIKKDFMQNGDVTGEYSLTYQIYQNTQEIDEYIGNTQDIKALTIKLNQSNELLAVLVYNFDEDRAISNQNSNFYITTKQIDSVDYYFFADIVQYKEV